MYNKIYKVHDVYTYDASYMCTCTFQMYAHNVIHVVQHKKIYIKFKQKHGK